MNPEQVVEEIRRRRGRLGGTLALGVFWMTLSGNRDEFALELRQVRGDWPLVPWVLRTAGLFRDSNAVMNDVTSILDEARCEIGDVADYARQRGGVDLVVLGRSELRLAITSLPILLPDWFPLTPGEMVTARIDDLTWSVEVAMSDEAMALSELRRLLYEIDRILIKRIRWSREADHRHVQALWERIQSDDDDDVAGALSRIAETLDNVANPASFRPSTARNPTLVGRLWRRANSISPEQLPGLARAVASALRVDGLELANVVPLVGVLNRPTNPISDAPTRWCFHLIVVLRSACQLATAAAHADDYPLFPAVLLRAVSRDLRQFLDAAIRILRAAPPSAIS